MSEPSIIQVESDEKPCPICGEMVEPEVDGDHRYYECDADDCEGQGYAFGYERVEETTRIEGNCAIGVPESVRRGASAGMEKALADEQRAKPINIQIGRRPNL